MAKKENIEELNDEQLSGKYLDIARDYFINMHRDTAYIAETLGVSQRIIQIWAKDGNWRHIKKTRQNLPSVQTQIVVNLYSQILEESEKPVDKIRYDLIAKLNKTIRDLEFVELDTLQIQTISKDFIMFLFENNKRRLIKVAILLLEEFQIWRKKYKK